MNTNRLLAAEVVTALGITSWGAIKQGYAPWPPNIMYSCVAFFILSGVAVFNDKLAATLGAGFLLALIVGKASGGKIANTFAALPPSGYDVLSLAQVAGGGPSAQSG